MKHVTRLQWTEAIANGVCLTLEDGTKRVRPVSLETYRRLNDLHQRIALRPPQGDVEARSSILCRWITRREEKDRFSWLQ